MTILDFIAAAEKIATQAEQAGTRFGLSLSLVLKQAERKMRNIIATGAEGASTAILKSQRAATAKREIRMALTSAGYDVLMAKATEASLSTVADAVLALRSAQDTLTETQAFLARVDALKALQEQDLLQLGDQLAYALWQATVRGIFGARPVSEILADLGGIMDKTEAQIRTIYDTNVSIFGRQVEALQAGNDPETLFLYLGPDDDKTRPFCQRHVGKVYTRDAIDAMDNGQLPNVFLTGGGFNCRHTWIEVAKSSELAPFADTGRRAPEFEQAA